MPLRRIQPVACTVSPLVHRHSEPALGSSTANLNAPADGDTVPQERSSNPLRLSQLQFALVWIVYVIVSLLNASLALIFAAIYYGAYSIRGGYMIEGVGLLSLENIPIVVASYTILSLIFWRLLVVAIVGSFRARRLIFKPERRRRALQKSRLLWLQRIRQFMATHIPFEVTFLVREIVEVATQSYQVYKCSTLISMHWINDFYVATLALNCWVAPIIHVKLRHNRPLQRFFYICSDVVLDFVSTFVVPVSIIFTIVLAGFEHNLSNASGDMDFAFDVPLSDVAFSNMVKAVQQVFVVTWLDVFTKVLPFISMATCLDQIQKYVQPRQHEQPAKRQASSSQSTIYPSHSTVLRARPPSTQPTTIPTSTTNANFVRQHKSHCITVIRLSISVPVVHVLFAVWGICLVGFHVQARVVTSQTTVFDAQGCKTIPHPWFVNKLSCTVLEINCHRHVFTGYAHEIASALSHVNPEGVGTLIISHCPQLYMPSQIQTLTNLMWLEIFNATLMDWGTDAALIDTKMPALQYLNVIRVNMTELPVGLQSPEFPRRLRDITIALSNLTTLPPDLHTKWKRMVNLVIERTLIDTIPATISQMNPSRLSLFNNRITHIPSDFFTRAANFWILSIARNPVSAWPETIGSLKRIYLVLMDYTEIAELPRWLTDEGERRARVKESGITVSAGGSPFCRARLNQRNETAREFAGLIIVCREKADEEMEAYMMSFFQPVRIP